jgi:hypothetical protein
MHTECADDFAKIKEFTPYADRVEVLHDGEKYCIDEDGGTKMVDINNIIAKENKNELSDFEKMVAKWLTYDYYCPTIKAEVIWDMLLSEFIPDILAYAVSKMEGYDEIKASSFFILAKEFPINTEEHRETLLSPKADYLVADEERKKIFIVELKTTLGSEKKPQLNNYLECKAEDMFDDYKKLITSKVGPSLYDGKYRDYKEPLDWKDSDKYASQITYMYEQFNKYTNDEVHNDELPKDRHSYVKRFHQAFIDKLKKHYGSDGNVEVYYLYVMRENNSRQFSVRVEKKEKKEETENNSYLIYRSGGDDILGKVLENEKADNQEINKLKAWKRLTAMIDAVGSYNEDFNDKKKYLENADK